MREHPPAPRRAVDYGTDGEVAPPAVAEEELEVLSDPRPRVAADVRTPPPADVTGAAGTRHAVTGLSEVRRDKREELFRVAADAPEDPKQGDDAMAEVTEDRQPVRCDGRGRRVAQVDVMRFLGALVAAALADPTGPGEDPGAGVPVVGVEVLVLSRVLLRNVWHFVLHSRMRGASGRRWRGGPTPHRVVRDEVTDLHTGYQPSRKLAGMSSRRSFGDGAAPRTAPGRSGLRDLTPRTRATYAGVLRQLAAWLDGRRLDDESLAAYLTHLRDAGGAPSTAALTVSALRREWREAGRRHITGKLTRRVLEDFRRKTGPDAPRRPGLTADECAAVLEACMRRRRNGRGLERAETAERRGLVDGALVALLFHGALRRSEVPALRWADVDLSDGDPVVVTLRRPADGGEDEDFRFLAGGCAAAVRRLHAATTPAPTDPVVGLGVDQINRRFAAACAAAGLEGRRTAHSGRVGLAVELAGRGAPTRAVQLAGGWKSPAMVVHYTASVTPRPANVNRYLRPEGAAGREGTGSRKGPSRR